ncbi:MAG TPA: helix-turn-helix domain-containing protein, partial [Ilumatobacteraceae bacterium]|nr:helix-turn-helix domain-containing protein [Ilumatobacteraceae bacterium]
MTDPALESASELTRRDEILDAAAAVFAESGVRTSLKEIADACGILPGSLYHHFDSRDAIVAELIARYEAEIADLADAASERMRQPHAIPGRDDVIELATTIASCAIRHRAALFLTMYDRPDNAGDRLVRAGILAPPPIVGAMLSTLRAAQAAGGLRSDVDVASLAERLCQSMLDLGAGMFHGSRGYGQMPNITTQLLLDGLTAGPVKIAVLDRSRAFKAAEQVIAAWKVEHTEGDDRGAVLRAAARSEFGRRGYEATTIRDIAAATGVSTGSVYRLVGSKEELLVSVMQSFAATVTESWSAVLESNATAVEKLDALMWVNINVLDRFTEEFRIQLGWVLESPPAVDLG